MKSKQHRDGFWPMAAKHGPSAYASHRQRCPLVPQLANGLVSASDWDPARVQKFFSSPALGLVSFLPEHSSIYVHVVLYSAVDSIATHYVKRHCHRQHVSNDEFSSSVSSFLPSISSLSGVRAYQVERLSALSHPAKSLKIAHYGWPLYLK